MSSKKCEKRSKAGSDPPERPNLAAANAANAAFAKSGESPSSAARAAFSSRGSSESLWCSVVRLDRSTASSICSRRLSA